MLSDRNAVFAWIRQCLAREDLTLLRSRRIGQGKSSHVWDCRAATAGQPADVVLKLYDERCEAYCGLPPAQVARKHSLALQELGERGLPVPRLLGVAASDTEAALLTEKVSATTWSPGTRVEAARALARLHAIEISDLSAGLAELMRISPPNRDRILNGVKGMAGHLDAGEPEWRAEHPQLSSLVDAVAAVGEPSAEQPTLVHGDYFSANILATSGGVCVVDWDLLSLGDPMWDLAFLVSADRDLEADEVEAVIAAYRETGPVAADRLKWNRDCWEAFWRLRELCHPRA